MDIIFILDEIGVVFDKFGYLIVFLSSFLEITPVGWAVPGGAVLVIAGYLANGQGELKLIPTILYGTAGVWIAFISSYVLGSKTGMWLVKKLHQGNNAKFAKTLLNKNGPTILTTSLLANLTRFWVSYIAGVNRFSFFKFNIYAFVASLTWVALMVFVGYFAGYEKDLLKQAVTRLGYLAWGLLLLAIFIIYKSIKHEYKHFKSDEPHINQDENNNEEQKIY
jgi:membrane protein DedA with SNARE-associated domain